MNVQNMTGSSRFMFLFRSSILQADGVGARHPRENGNVGSSAFAWW